MKSSSYTSEKPAAYRSPLWAHLDEIRKKRFGRATWPEIVTWLKTHHNLTVARTTLIDFFKRATSPKHRTPLGFEAFSAINNKPEVTVSKTLPPLHKGDGIFYFSETDQRMEAIQKEFDRADKAAEREREEMAQLQAEDQAKKIKKQSNI
jgi:hypothetical protein